MSTYSKAFAQSPLFQRVLETLGVRKHRELDERDNAVIDALRLVEQRSDDVYPSVLSHDLDLTSAAHTGCVITGANLVGDTEKAKGSTSNSAGEILFTAVLPGLQEIAVTIVDDGSSLTVTADAEAGTIDIVHGSGGGGSGGASTAAQVVAAVRADGVAKYMVYPTVTTGGDMDEDESLTVQCSNRDPGALPVLMIGDVVLDGTTTGCGITSFTDTAITFDFDASGLTPLDTEMMRLWVDDVMVLCVPLIVDNDLEPGEVTDEMLDVDRGKTAGYWTGFTGGSTDISGDAATRDIKVNFDGAGDSNVTISKTGLNTGAKIAAAIQVALRAVGTGGYTDCRVVYLNGRYVFISGTRGSTSSVAVSAGTSNDLATSLKVLAADGGVAFTGCDDLDQAAAQFTSLLATLSTTGLLRALGTDQITEAVLLQAVVNGAFTATANTRALFADGIWSAAKLASASVTPPKIDASSYFVMEDDFALPSGGTLPSPLLKDTETANVTGDYDSNSAGGTYHIVTDSTNEAQSGQVTWNGQLLIDPTKKPIFEALVQIKPSGTALAANETAVFGLCSSHPNAEDSLDAVASNVWFRMQGANNDILVEGDDGTHDTDDTDTTVNWVKATAVLLKIDMTDLSAVVFSIDGTPFATTLNLSGLTGSNLLQPIFALQRSSGVGAAADRITIDWYRVYTTR